MFGTHKNCFSQQYILVLEISAIIVIVTPTRLYWVLWSASQTPEVFHIPNRWGKKAYGNILPSSGKGLLRGLCCPVSVLGPHSYHPPAFLCPLLCSCPWKVKGTTTPRERPEAWLCLLGLQYPWSLSRHAASPRAVSKPLLSQSNYNGIFCLDPGIYLNF